MVTVCVTHLRLYEQQVSSDTLQLRLKDRAAAAALAQLRRQLVRLCLDRHHRLSHAQQSGRLCE